MHCVYFARHGETVWNVENKICGMTDSPLPALVFILFINPCSFFSCLFFGWNVLFILNTS